LKVYLSVCCIKESNRATEQLTHNTPTLTSMSLETRKEQIEWLEANTDHLTEQQQEQLNATLAMGDALADIVIAALYSTQVKVEAEFMAECEKQLAIKQAAIECELLAMNKPLTIAPRGGGTLSTDENIKKYFKQIKSGKQVVWALKDGANLKIAANAIAAVKGEALSLAKQLADNKANHKKSGGKKRRSSGDEVEEWVLNTEDDARAQYKSGMYASKYDLQQKAIYKEQMKVWNKGTTDPRDKSKTLEKDLVKFQYKAVVRTDPIADAEADRCCGAVAWKAGRYGSEWASKKGFKGSVMSQCSKQVKGGGFCAGCKGKGIDFFADDSKYKKSGISYSMGYSGDGLCVLIE
jgi:hypothetical protein